jgi:hypothetical protein
LGNQDTQSLGALSDYCKGSLAAERNKAVSFFKGGAAFFI